MLGPLVDLYYATGNKTLLNLASTIAAAGIRDYSDPATGVMREACETDKAPNAQTPPGCGQDQIAFKGIFAQGLAELYLANNDENIYNYLSAWRLARRV